MSGGLNFSLSAETEHQARAELPPQIGAIIFARSVFPYQSHTCDFSYDFWNHNTGKTIRIIFIVAVHAFVTHIGPLP